MTGCSRIRPATRSWSTRASSTPTTSGPSPGTAGPRSTAATRRTPPGCSSRPAACGAIRRSPTCPTAHAAHCDCARRAAPGRPGMAAGRAARAGPAARDTAADRALIAADPLSRASARAADARAVPVRPEVGRACGLHPAAGPDGARVRPGSGPGGAERARPDPGRQPGAAVPVAVLAVAQIRGRPGRRCASCRRRHRTSPAGCPRSRPSRAGCRPASRP